MLNVFSVGEIGTIERSIPDQQIVVMSATVYYRKKKYVNINNA